MEESEPKRIFLKLSISSRLKCPICYDVFLRPRRLFCGHTFCKTCLKKMFKPHKNPEHVPSCPLCRQPIDTNNIGYDLIAISIIDELEVACPVNGCPWRGQNQLLQTHYNFQCRLKNYIRSYAGNSSINLTSKQVSHVDDDITEKLNQNLQKGSLISRVISKNPHLLNLTQDNRKIDRPIYWQKQYTKQVKNMVTRGTQTRKHGIRKGKQETIEIQEKDEPIQSRASIENHHFKMPEATAEYSPADFQDSESVYRSERSHINVINLQLNKKKIHIRRTRPKAFRM